MGKIITPPGFNKKPKKLADIAFQSAPLEKIAMLTIEQRRQLIADFGKAYLAETGLFPSEIVLCEKKTDKGMEWFFRRKGEVEFAHQLQEQERELKESEKKGDV